MSHLARRLISGLFRRLGAWPVKAMGLRQRAAVLEGLTEQMVSSIAVPGATLRFFTPSPLLLLRAETILTKETDTIEWIEGLDERGVFWDIGANIGVYSLYAILRRSVTVLAFEPAAANFHVLSRNIQLNDL